LIYLILHPTGVCAQVPFYSANLLYYSIEALLTYKFWAFAWLLPLNAKTLLLLKLHIHIRLRYYYC